MKNLLIIPIIVSVSLVSCKDIEDVKLVKKVGSNTEYQSFLETENNEVYLLGKNTLRKLNNTFVSNLNFERQNFDSISIEKISLGNKINAILSSKGFFAGNTLNSLLKVEKNDFTLCDQIVVLDSMILIQTGKNDCNFLKNSELSIYKEDASKKISLISKTSFEAVSDWVVMENLLWILYKNGTMEIFGNAENKNIVPITSINLSPELIQLKLMGSQKKVIAFGAKKMVQLKLNSNNKIELINEI